MFIIGYQFIKTLTVFFVFVGNYWSILVKISRIKQIILDLTITISNTINFYFFLMLNRYNSDLFNTMTKDKIIQNLI